MDKIYVSNCCGEEVENIQWVGDEGCARCPDCKEGCGVEELEPEKQEEWRENIREVLEGNSIFLKSPVEGVEPLTKLEIIEWIVETELDKVSQLLSERTFTLEELIKITQMFSHYEVCSGGLMEEDRKIVEKISKLLKEEE
jgi:hypothetical protein